MSAGPFKIEDEGTFAMLRRGRTLLGIATVVGSSVLGVSPAAAAPPTAAPDTSGPSTGSATLVDLVRGWAAAGASYGGGTFADGRGQALRPALAATGASASGVVVGVRPAANTGNLPHCTGVFNDTSATVSLQESASSIPWGVSLAPANAAFGVVNFNAQIFADNYQANGYQQHTEPWDYKFHGNLGNPFQVRGGGTHEMTSGRSEVSFLWYWSSAAAPSQGGYAYNNCVYDKNAN
jgi:hypothetical protein